ncbi:GntR family transcriptional regulator [Xenorhabdus vietnamensis]|uniref:GntR family transcriptional regulator n=1 Tax=Xenorhabdus vietnamensis TaxID=351656 RepID=A0A1Y2SJ92_9GAMM|nr:PLP-dependent aminotransferase family protein [Xenorhabdus vietnamensis]OTA18476.1 GntR family transcriptional regulator [Xenorhabdus vietnamensis]
MKKKTSSHFPNLLLEKGCIKDQVYHAIREAILYGHLCASVKVPSSRALAEMMSISRNSVLSAFERLIDEGYLVTRQGSGTFVSPIIPDELTQTKSKKKIKAYEITVKDNINPNIKNVEPLWKKSRPDITGRRIFSVGVGCVDLFPHELWGRLLGRVWRQSKKELAQFNDPAGYQALKDILCHYVRSTRGLYCHAEQIIIVNGTQQAINLTARVLLRENDEVWLDDPGYDGALGILTSVGAKVRSVIADENGMDISYGIKHWPNAKLVFTAPSHQFPLGSTLSLSRRLTLLEWAAKHQVWIFEDDYNSEFRYFSKPIQALQGLDQQQRVIYAGSFSKMMYPGFRLGFLVVPEQLIEPFKLMKYYTDSHSGYLEQATLAQFISEGHYTRHVRRIRKICYERREVLINAIKKYLPHIFKVQPADSGIHMVCWLLNGLKENEVIEKCHQIGLNVQPLSRYCMKPYEREAVLLGYAAHTPTEIEENIKRLSSIL